MSRDRIPELESDSGDGTPALATTNEAKAKTLAESFYPEPPSNPNLPHTAYPKPLPDIKYYTKYNIHTAIQKLQPYKAPGPDGIPNVVLKKCADTLVPYLYYIYRAVFELNTYHDEWRVSTTLVLRKPNRNTYSNAKSFRPIGLLNTIGKLLSTLAAADLTFLAEKHHLLPPNQFGGRPGRNTTDALHLVTSTVKNAWRSGNVAAALFLDVQSAFPNTTHEQLLHNLRERGIPTCYINLIRRMLTGRKTRLQFNDFISDLIDVLNGTTQGCPLSMILYAFYNAALIEVARRGSKSETASGFVDDSMFIAVSKTLTQCHNILKNLMERAGGGFDWSTTHYSLFELSKLAVVNFPRSHRDEIPPDLVLKRINRDATTTTQTIATKPSYKYLGVIVDSKLRWNAHTHEVVKRATLWSLQIMRLSRPSVGMPPKQMRQLFNTVAVPAITYASDVWYTEIHESKSGAKRLGSVSVTKKLAPSQRRVARAITGALSTTAGDVLDVHADLLPVELLFSKVIFRAAARLASLPEHHPLYPLIRKASTRNVSKHKSPLHNIFQHTKLKPTTVETIQPIRRHPGYQPSFRVMIAENKAKGLTMAENGFNTTTISAFSDGSGYERGVGASAVLYEKKVEKSALKYHLGTTDEHTVYEAEIVGMLLAFHQLHTQTRRLPPKVVLGTDSQALLKALGNQRPHPAHHLLDRVHDAAEKLHIKQDRLVRATERRKALAEGRTWEDRTRKVFRLHLIWTPGHVDFEPNERADELAKEAAQGSTSPANLLPPFLRKKPLPISIPAARQSHLQGLRIRWARKWKRSPRYTHISTFDKKLPSKGYMRLLQSLNRRHSAILTQLRTLHVPLNHHLFRIRRSETPICPHCPQLEVETVLHYLLKCPHYKHERHKHLRRKLQRSSNSLNALLSTADAQKPLIKYLIETKRFDILSEKDIPQSDD